MVKLHPDSDILTFQCKDILSRDVFVQDETEEYGEGDRDRENSKQFQILLFGSDAAGNSICLQVDNFKPFFYVRIPSILAQTPSAKHCFLHWVLRNITSTEIELVEETHKTLFDFTNGTLCTFYKLIAPSQAVWRDLKNLFLTKSSSEPIPYETKHLFGKQSLDVALCKEDVESISEDGSTLALKIYEANIDPVLRFFHIQNVSPAGWIAVDPGNWTYSDAHDAKTTLSAVADCSDIRPGVDNGMAPYLVASWDIECNSSHGDFPLPKKTWRKPIRDMMDASILPETVEALCALVATNLRGDESPIAPIYLQKGESWSAETLRHMLEGKRLVPLVKRQLLALRTADSADTRDVALSNLEKSLTDCFPKIAGDEIIQIGTVLYRRGVPVSKHIWVKGSVDEQTVKPPGIDVPISVMGYADELSLIKAWFEWMGRKQPDVLIGYNIFGFDSKYVYDRLEELIDLDDDRKKKVIQSVLSPLSCLKTRPPRLEEKFLSSSAMGDNTMWFISSPGRLQIDLLPYIRRNHNLDSYSLDNVSATFVSGDIKGPLKKKEEGGESLYTFPTKSTKGTVVGRYITLMDEENDRIVEKCLVVGVEPKSLTVQLEGELLEGTPVRWAQVKDDVHPKDIFRLHRGSAKDRAIIARYCLQDCDLVMELFHKLEILNNSVAMAHVCSVPVAYIFLRGQGIKIESLIFKECRNADQLIEVMPSRGFDEPAETETEKEEEEDSYEGAIVLEPKTGVYIDDPITADDFASLYPSSIISENISHDTLISVKDYGLDGSFLGIKEGSDRYDNLPGASYVNIEFDILRPDAADTRKHPVKLKMGTRIARYIQKPQGTIPRILEMLLASRKKCRKLAETEKDEFRKALLDAQQLAYKLTANSLYGQLGSGTFKIRRQVLAASTTAYGRKQLMYAKAVIEKVYGGGVDPRCDVECIYGDTDSIFLRFRPKDPITGKRLTGAAALRAAKELTIESGKLVSSCLKPPHDFEFDKIFRSFCLLSKKRYVGDMSEDGLEDADFHRKSMGIVMKRRDNAPIVKYVYRKAIDTILDPTKEGSSGVREAAQIVQSITQDLLLGKFPLTKLTITKSLRSEYKDPSRIAHKVLADRIGERDPGNKPSTSDRIPYVYITRKGPVPKLQGDRIELPSYIKEHNLTPDYEFYITNQIAKPVNQVFGLVVEFLPGVKKSDIDACGKAKDPVAAREKLADTILFQTALIKAAQVPSTMEAKGQRSIASFFH